MAKVFISYSRKDIDFAKRLTAELQKSELDFWIDWEGIPPTVDWWREIEKGIEEADAFLFLISPDSAESKVCGQEIDHAVKNGKRLIPLVIRDTSADEVHSKLKSLNWIFFHKEENFDASIEKLLTSIHTDFEWVEVQRRLQIRALEWERNHKENSFLLRGKDLGEAEQQLATNSSKEPYPTDLQREYVFESRKAADRQRRIVTGVSIVGVIALTALAVFGFYQSGQSANNAATAQANFVAAATAKVDAQNKQALADENAAIAVENEQEAIRQAQIALARQLASQAQSINTTLSSKQVISTLLDIQSMKYYPNREATSFLINDNKSAFITTRMTHDGEVNSIAFSPDGKFVVSGSWDDTARVWNSATGKEITRITHDDVVTSVAFSPDGKYVVSGSGDGTARVWEAQTREEIARMIHDDDGIMSVAFSPDGYFVVSGNWDGTARVWEAETGKEIARITHDDDVRSVAFSLDGQFVVSSSGDGTIRIWKADAGKEIARITHGDDVFSVAFSPEGKYVVSSSTDGIARVRDAANGQEVSRMSHDGYVASVAFSPDGQFVVSSGRDGTARVWEAETGKEIARITHDDAVTSVAFSPDGKYVVSGSGDGTARVWETLTGTEATRMNHEGNVYSVTFSPDGKFIVSGSEDGTARVWEWRTDDLIANACATMARNLTLAEWQQYVGVEIPYEVVCDPENYPNAVIPKDAQEYLDSQKQ